MLTGRMKAPSLSWRFGIASPSSRHSGAPPPDPRGARSAGANPESSSYSYLWIPGSRRRGAPRNDGLDRAQHILMHPAAVEMKKRHRGVVAERPGGETFFQFAQNILGHGMQVGQRL